MIALPVAPTENETDVPVHCATFVGCVAIEGNVLTVSVAEEEVVDPH